MPTYGPPYGWGSNSFINANNFSGGCYSAQNSNPALCNDTARELTGDPFNVDFWSDLPGFHDDMWAAENAHAGNVFIASNHIDPLDERLALLRGVEWVRRPTGPQDPQNSTPLSTGEIDSLFADLKKTLSIKDCNEFIKSTLEQLKINTKRSQHGTTDILVLFDAVKKGRGFDWRSMSAEATGGGGPGVASMSINPTRQWALKGAVGRGGTLIHELLHVAGYDHDAIAKAMYDVGGRFDKSWKAWRGDFPDAVGDRFFAGEAGQSRLDGAYSGFIKNLIDQHCK